MVTAGLLPEPDRPAIAEMLMRDNPGSLGGVRRDHRPQ